VNLIWNTIRRATWVALLFFCQSALPAQPENVQALWIVRDHITTPNSIDKILSFASEHGYNHLFVQVRGRGDAYYTSKLVPRTHLLTKSNFDPLAYFLKKAHQYNLKVHAWLNVYYLWSSPWNPTQKDHLLLTRPKWIDSQSPDFIDIDATIDSMKRNKKSNGEGFYLAPTHPEVDAHLQNVITELLQNYHLDGIHFDYIRYHDLEYGMNPVGLKFFLDFNSSIPGLPSLEVQQKPTFADYKRSAITRFISKASTRIKAYQPNCIISAAVKPNLYSARNTFGQEWDVWLAGGYIDWAVPMNYSIDMSLFDKNIQIMKQNLPEKFLSRIVMGVATYNQTASSAGKKIYHANMEDFGGVSIFSYTVFKDQPSYARKLIKYFK